jgi:hypothetical protein
MQTVNIFVHAAKQAPWRIQRQWVIAFLLGVLGLAMVAALYLDVTASAAIAGREIQDLTAGTTTLQHANADLQTRVATLTSSGEMAKRALALGFRPVEPREVEYLLVPGYAAPTPAILAAGSEPGLHARAIPPEYTESLLDWINLHLHKPFLANPAGGPP